MASSPITNQKASSHTRSISMPCRSHPLTLNVEEHLYRLKYSSRASSSPACHTLNDLKELYESVDDMLQMSLVQKSLCHEKLKDDIMEGSLKVLDACSITRDAFSQMKASVQDLQSSLRRRKGEESNYANEVKNFMVSRNKVMKMVGSSFRNLNKMEKRNSSLLLDRGSDLASIATVVMEVEETSLSVFESLLSFVRKPKTSNWSSLASKLTKSKRVSCEGEDKDCMIKEVESINKALTALKTVKCINIEQVRNVQNSLGAFETSIKEVEDELECVFRRIIKTRVSLLNNLRF